MRCLQRAALLPVMLLAVFAAAQSEDPTAGLHEVCYREPGASTTWRISINTQATTFNRTTSSGTTDSALYPVLAEPSPNSPWSQGVEFAAQMQSQSLFPLTDAVTGATWVNNPSTRVDNMTFTTASGSVIFLSTLCPGWNNCPYRGGTPKHCWDGIETCCGYNTIFPQCAPANGNEKCCIWYLAAARCNSTQSCCGSGGTGASSYAFCCNEGSTCCHGRSSTTGSSACCPTGTTCCAASGLGLCCKDGETCDVLGNRCVAPDGTTNAPGVPETTTSSSTPTTVPATSTPSDTTTSAAPSGSTTTTAAPSGSTTTAAPSGQTTTTSAPAGTTTTTSPAGETTTAGGVTSTTSAPGSTDAVETNAPAVTQPVTFSARGSVFVAGTFFTSLISTDTNRVLLQNALKTDIANALLTSSENVTISSTTADSNGLTVNFTVVSSTDSAASSIVERVRNLATQNVTLPATTAMVRVTNPTVGNLTVSQSSSAKNDNNNGGGSDSAASGLYGPALIAMVAVGATLLVL